MPVRSQATEDRFLGALLGMAIGDALGRPLRGMSAAQIRQTFGDVRGYVPDVEADSARDTDRNPDRGGEISDKTEIVLCLVESLTTNDGLIDPVNINVRIGFLARGPSGELMSGVSKQGVQDAAGNDGLVPEDGSDIAELAVATRGVVIGLLHAVGGFDSRQLGVDAATVSRLTHRGPGQATLVGLVATHVQQAARGEPLTSSDRESALELEADALASRGFAEQPFEDIVLEIVREGGEADTRAAIAGAIAGARQGVSGIPQQLIDDLDARIYLSLAAPWFYRTAIRRAGLVIDLRSVDKSLPGT